MKRLFAVVGLAAFIAACSDSNPTAPVSRAQPHGASRVASDPPPPPLNGLTGDGDLFTEGSDLSPLAVSTNSVAQCTSSQDFSFSFSGSYFANNPGTNERARIQLGPPGDATGFIDVHELANGHSDASGHITNSAGFSFDIQSGDGTITPIFGGEPSHIIGVAFNFSVTGIITDPSGGKCRASGSLFSGSD
jgi:hypothetical protein